jgi:chromosome segregation ATPase
MLSQVNGMADTKKNIDLTTQLASVQTQLKQVKTELELAKVKSQLKDKEIELLKQKFAAQCKRLVSSSRSRYTSNRRRTSRLTNSSAANQQAVQKKALALKNVRLLKYYESERTELYQKIKSAKKNLKLAKETIGKTSRKYKVRQCESALKSLYSQSNVIKSKIKKLKYKVY